MAQMTREAMSQPYDLLLGRRTYELFAAHFSAAEDAQSPMNRSRK